MSVQCQVPEQTITDALVVLRNMSFSELVDSFLRGTSYHLKIHGTDKFEMCPDSITAVGGKEFRFSFWIQHECHDDRSWWVTDDYVWITACSDKEV